MVDDSVGSAAASLLHQLLRQLKLEIIKHAGLIVAATTCQYHVTVEVVL